MQPYTLPLRIHKGATFRARLRVMQPSLEYRDITGIAATAPVRLTVEHGLPADWPVWVERVQQLPELNRAVQRQEPHHAVVIDEATLEINRINAAGTRASGGQIIYHRPLPLGGATAALSLFDKGQPAGTLPVEVNAAGWVDLVLTDEQTAELGWTERTYALDVTLGSGDVLRVYEGVASVVPAGQQVSGTCQGYAVLGGDRGPRGPTVAGAEVDAEGRLVITMEDGYVIVTDPINRPWGSIIGNILEQTDLVQLIAQAVADRVLNDDPRLSDARVPKGGAGGVLSGQYPNVGFAVDMATQAELDNAILTRTTPQQAADAAPVQTVQGRAGNVTVTREDLNVENVSNTSDMAKPVSTAQQAALDEKLSISQIVDNLGSAAADRPLSANQGRILKSLIDNIDAILSSNDTSLDEIQEIVDYIKQNRQDLQALGISNIAGLVDALSGKADTHGDYANLRARSTTKADVGLGQADNTPDAQKPVSAPQQQALDGKVGKVTGKGLSTEDFTTELLNKLNGIAAEATKNATDAQLRDRATHTGTQAISTVTGLQTELNNIHALIGNTAAALDLINGEVIP